MPSKSVSLWLPQVIIESILIVVSILVALGLDAWRQNRENEEFVLAALANFAIEIKQNQARIDDAAPFNLGLLKIVALHYDADDIVSVDAFINLVEIYSPAELQSTAWDTALATGSLARMDYHLVTALSLTYSLQDRYDLTTRSGMGELTNPQYLSTDRLRLATYNSIRFLDDVTSMEDELAITYVEAARVIDNAMGKLGADNTSTSAVDLAHP